MYFVVKLHSVSTHGLIPPMYVVDLLLLEEDVQDKTTPAAGVGTAYF